MSLLKNAGLKARFLTVPLLASLSLAVLAGLFFHAMDESRAMLAEISEEHLRKKQKLNDLLLDLSNQYAKSFELITHLGQGDLDSVRERAPQYVENIQKLVQEFGTYSPSAYTHTGHHTLPVFNKSRQKLDIEQAEYETLKSKLQEFETDIKAAVQTAQTNPAASHAAMLKANAAYARVNAHLRDILQRTAEETDTAFAQMHQENDSHYKTCLIISFGFILAIFVLTFLLSRGARTPAGTADEMLDMLHEKNRELQQLKTRAEESSETKSEFLANMSHELRTPLNSIIGLTRILLDEDLTHDQKDMVKTTYKSATSLLTIVNDILDISKIEAGSLSLENMGFDLREVIGTTVETMAPVASEKGISLHCNFKSEDGLFVRGDSFRTGRVLLNLISNAIKYTEKGHVDVIVDTNRPDAETLEFYCEVRDTGIGIAEDKLDVIFDKYAQADPSIARKFGGTGLGLKITRDLVKLMQGEIGVNSTLGTGSTFWIRIRFPVAEEIESREMQAQHAWSDKDREGPAEGAERLPAAEVRLLVAEDHPLNQAFIERLLKRMGFEQCDILENGVKALKAYKNGTYDLILMDCHMPEMDGYDTTREVRKWEEGGNKRTPIIALTADAMAGTREKCLEAGMDDYISKPVDSARLQQALSRWVIFDKTLSLPGSGPLPQSEVVEISAPVNMELMKGYAETPEELQNYIDVFLSQTAESMEIMRKHCVDGPSPEWSEAAHKIKSGAGMVGAEKLKKLCEKAQNMKESTRQDREKILEDIQGEYDAIEAYVM